MSSPLITIITVVYNDVHNLERTILSVLNQTYPNIEYIIIDGASTDGTVDVIKKYADRLGYWISEKDGGMFEAMNKGVAQASGEWVNILNSGDYLLTPTIIEEIFNQEYPEADILYGGFIGNFSGQPVICPANQEVKTRAWRGMQACHSAMFARNQVAKKFLYNTNLRHSADGDFFARCLVSGCRFERLDKIIFRVGTLGNSSKNWLPCRKENWQIARTYFPGFKTNWFHLQGICREYLFRIFKSIASLFGLYQLARYWYHKKLKQKVSLLPKGITPYKE